MPAQDLEGITEQFGGVYLTHSKDIPKVNLEIARYLVNHTIHNASMSRCIKKLLSTDKDIGKMLKIKNPVLPRIYGLGYATHMLMRDFFLEKYKKKVEISPTVENHLPTLKKIMPSPSGRIFRNGFRY